jgi:hypothetical protein
MEHKEFSKKRLELYQLLRKAGFDEEDILSMISAFEDNHPSEKVESINKKLKERW